MVCRRRLLGSLSLPGLGLSALSLLGSGCHIQNCELVETALRDRECKLRELSEEVERLRGQNEALARELGVTRESASAKTALPKPELASQSYALTAVKLGMQTGGYNADKSDPGDEMLQVVLIPEDSDKSPIKAPGTLDVFAYEVTKEGIKKLIGTWRVSPDQLRKTWSNNIIATGYFVKLPWKAYPSTKKMRVVARFTLTDGRPFEADKDFEVTLVEPQYQKPQTSEYPDVPAVTETAPGGEMSLPMPKKEEPPLAPPEKDSEGPEIPQAPRPGAAEPAAHWQPAQAGRPSGPAVQLLKPVVRSAKQ
jgi:hypothetical protein